VWDRSERRIKIAVDPRGPGGARRIFNIWPSLILKWMPDGREIFYRERQVGYQPETEILRLDVATGKSSLLLSTAPEYIVDLSFSRDGQKVALVRGRNSSNAVILSTAPTAGR
jgi:Tol biopolymer transport system component